MEGPPSHYSTPFSILYLAMPPENPTTASPSLVGRADTEKPSPAALGSLITHIHGAWYDLTPWRSLHPGGPFALDLAAGRDGTVLYEQSHPFSSKAMLLALLEPLRVAPELAPALYARYPHVVAEAACFSFSSAPATGKASGGSSSSGSSTAVGASHDDAFEVEVKRLAHDYFQKEAMRRGVSVRAATKAPPERWAGCLALGLAFVFLGALPLVRGEWLALLLAPVLLWLFMVNYWHDASHFAMSTDWRVNWALQYLAPWFSSPLVWSHQHIIGHHAYTNVQGRDPDLYHAPSLWRFSEDVRWRPSHGWQVWSTLFLWTLSVPTLLLLKPLAMLRSKTLNRAVPLMQLSFARIALHLLGRLLVLFSLYVWPYLVFPAAKATLFAVVPISIYSLLFMICSQVNHHSEEMSAAGALASSGAASGGSSTPPVNWYRHQTSTSHTIAPDSSLAFWGSGGLNLQIEHHLFPCVNHWHLARLQPLVEAAAAKHGVHYPKSTSFLEALLKVFTHLEHMAVKPAALAQGPRGQ